MLTKTKVRHVALRVQPLGMPRRPHVRADTPRANQQPAPAPHQPLPAPRAHRAAHNFVRELAQVVVHIADLVRKPRVRAAPSRVRENHKKPRLQRREKLGRQKSAPRKRVERFHSHAGKLTTAWKFDHYL